MRELVSDEHDLDPRNRAASRRATAAEAVRTPSLAAAELRGTRSFDLPEVEGLISPNARRRDAIYRRGLIVADVIAASLSITISVVLVGHAVLRPTMLIAFAAVVGSSKVLGLYDRDELVFHKSTLDEAPKLFQLGAFYAFATWLLAPALIDGPFPRTAQLTLWLSAFVLACLLRFGAREIARRVAPVERCLIVGRSGTRMRLTGKLTAAQRHTEVVGYLPLGEERRRGAQGHWNGNDRRRRTLKIDDLPELVRELDVHRVVVIPGEADADTMIDAISRAKASGVKVSILPRLFEIVGSSVEFDSIEGITVLGVRRFGLSRSSAALKRMTDIAGAVFGLAVLAPLFVLIAVAIKLDSRGPVFYRALRIGRRGRPFRMLKFRSMVANADELKHELREQSVDCDGLFKVIDDPRMTRVGRLIRKAKLDELPQLVNVLRGEMSLVGPRPLVPDEDYRVYGHFRRRLRVVPGVTGPWQILGPARVPLAEMVVIDYLYGANWSLWVDIKILLRTAGHVVRARGL